MMTGVFGELPMRPGVKPAYTQGQTEAAPVPAVGTGNFTPQEEYSAPFEDESTISAQPVVSSQPMQPVQQPTAAQKIVNEIVTPELQEKAMGTKVWTEFSVGDNIRGEIIGNIEYAGDNGFAPKIQLTVMEDNGKTWSRVFSSSDNDSWRYEKVFYDVYNKIQDNWNKKKKQLYKALEQPTAGTTLPGSVWKTELAAIYKEKGDKKGRTELEWTEAATRFRDKERQTGATDQQILDTIKCI
jgi:hypothetical protein